MAFTTHHLAMAVARANARMGTLADELNAADARLGDGDTGSMLARLTAVFATVDVEAQPDVGAAFMALAKAGASSTGSSLGTLVITAMMTAGKETAGQSEIGWDRLGSIVGKVRDAAMVRGKAELGAKTIVDGLDALARALDGKSAPGVLGEAAVAAMDGVLAEFRGRPCTMGRARMFAERSVGLDDPGMLALAELVKAVTSGHVHQAGAPA